MLSHGWFVRAYATCVLALLAVSCGKSQRESVSPGASLDPDAGYLAVVRSKDLSQVPVGISSAARATAVVVFSSWCAPCREELRLLGELAATYPELRVIGVNAFEDFEGRSDRNQLTAYIRDRAPWMRVVIADPSLLAALGGVTKVPTLFLYDKSGQLLTTFRRSERPPPDKAELADAVRNAIR